MGATLEACDTGGLHVHLALQFSREVDRTARSFAFEKLTPNVQAGDYLGEGLNKRRMELSVNRGFFYVFADKVPGDSLRRVETTFDQEGGAWVYPGVRP